MALSLADELASAFGDEVQDGYGGGLSLAEEFGLDMDPVEEGHTQSNDRAKDIPVTPPHGSLAIPVVTLIGKRGTTPKRGKSLSSMLIMEDNSSLELDNMAVEEDDHHAQLDNTSYETNHHRDYEDATQQPSLSPGARASSGFLGHRADKDPLITLNEILRANNACLELLAHLDQPRFNRGPSSSKHPVPRDIESMLQTHLNKLHEADRIREEQCRELGILSRQVANVRWENVNMEIEMELASGHGLGLGMIDEDDNEEEGDGADDLGWTGDPHTSSTEPIGRSGTLEQPQHLGPPSPIHRHSAIPFSPLPPPPQSPTDSHALPPSPIPSTAALPQTTRLLQTSTIDLLATLANLSDSLHASMSFSTSKARQVRGIKASIDSWREREMIEREAREGIEEWERRRLASGLKGDKSREVRDTLTRELKEFDEVLDGLQRRMDYARSQSFQGVAVA